MQDHLNTRQPWKLACLDLTCVQEEGCRPGPVALHGVVGLPVATHVGGRVDAADGRRKGHEAPAAVLPHLPVHQVARRQCISRLGQNLCKVSQLQSAPLLENYRWLSQGWRSS